MAASFGSRAAKFSPGETVFQAGESPPESTETQTAIAILGGFFDPVHNGHLKIAGAALRGLPVREITFLPAARLPHRRKGRAVHRLEMLRLALAGDSRFRIDDRELRREGPSYTVITLRELAAESPGSKIYFLVGADNIPDLKGWHEAEEILDLCSPVVYPREGHPSRFETDDLPFLSPARLRELNSQALRCEPVAVSSTLIRERARRGESIEGLVPPAVAEYIETHRLYREDAD